MDYEKSGENKMKQFDYLQSVMKVPGVRALYVFDEKGNEVFRESTFSKDKEYYKNLVEYYAKNRGKIPKLFYLFTDTHLVILAQNPDAFKGFVLCISFKDTNLGLLRINIKKFLKLD